MSNPVVTLQPTPSAPLEEKVTANGIMPENITPSAPPMESVVVTQPTMNNMNIDSEKLMCAQTEVLQLELDKERARRREDFCCYACADSCVDDTWCWYIMCRMYCQCLGMCCEGCANCLDSSGDCCADCMHGCCESGDGNNGCCSGDSNDGCCGGDSNDGCCSGGDTGDAGCCDDGCDCDCGGCFD